MTTDLTNKELVAKQNRLFIGDVAPDFTAETTKGPIEWHKFIDGKWAILFSHPAAFTPVCTTELGQVALLESKLAVKDTVVAGLSVDSVKSNSDWIADINEFSNCDVQFPIISDEDYKVSLLYGMLNQDHVINGKTVTARTVFFIGPDKKIRATLTYPASSGRDFNEIFRLLETLQLTENSSVATPVNWRKGDKVVIIPSISTEDAKKKFSNVEVIKPYLRLTKLDE